MILVSLVIENNQSLYLPRRENRIVGCTDFEKNGQRSSFICYRLERYLILIHLKLVERYKSCINQVHRITSLELA